MQSQEGSGTVNDSDARFEFRCWARDFSMVETRLPARSDCHDVRESDEIYIVAADSDDTNVKIRDGALEIKALIEKRDGLEQWQPLSKIAFPLTAAALRDEVLPQLGAAVPSLARETYSVDAFLAEIVAPHPGPAAAQVSKRRFAFTVNGCMTERDEVRIDGAGLQSIAIESTDPAAVLEARHVLGLDELENVNYLQAIKRVIGMEPLGTPY